MGTRSVVSFYDDGQPVAGVYRQYDGYLGGRGKELAEFLSARTLVNGFGGADQTAENTANGMGDLAAQWVATEKRDSNNDSLQLGNVYMRKAAEGDAGDDYTYRVDYDKGELRITVWSWGDMLLDRGTVAQFIELVESE